MAAVKPPSRVITLPGVQLDAISNFAE